MHIVEKQYLGLMLKNASHSHVLRDTAIFAANAFLDAVGEYNVITKDEAMKVMWGFLSSPDNKYYLFTEKAREVIQNIKITDSFDIQILRVLPMNETRYFNFLYGKDRVVFCMWSNEILHVIDLSKHEGKEGIKRVFSLAPLRNDSKINTFTDELREAVRHLIFLTLTEPEITLVAAGSKQGTRKKGHYNATPLPVIIVDSKWNKYIVRTDGFGVSGHFRMQRCGKGYADLKLTWIEPYKKHGYVRLPKAEAIEESE